MIHECLSQSKGLLPWVHVGVAPLGRIAHWGSSLRPTEGSDPGTDEYTAPNSRKITQVYIYSATGVLKMFLVQVADRFSWLSARKIDDWSVVGIELMSPQWVGWLDQLIRNEWWSVTSWHPLLCARPPERAYQVDSTSTNQHPAFYNVQWQSIYSINKA